MKLYRVLRHPRPAVILVAASSAAEASGMATRLNDFLVDSVQVEGEVTDEEDGAIAVATEVSPGGQRLDSEVVTEVGDDSMTAEPLPNLLKKLRAAEAKGEV